MEKVVIYAKASVRNEKTAWEEKMISQSGGESRGEGGEGGGEAR